jgi:hypothetical protein
VKTLLMIITGICIATAAILMWYGDLPAAFVIAVIGMVAWALNYRIQMKEALAAADGRSEEDLEKQDSDEIQ